MENTTFKTAICQIRTELDQGQTMKKAEGMVREAAENGAQVVCLPEMFNCPYSRKYFRTIGVQGHESSVKAMSSWARENRIVLIGGSVPEIEDGKIYNTCFVFNEKGEQIARHRKIHLFDVDIPGMCFRESDTFTSGRDITVFDTRYGRFGVAICFDVRFPELFRAMAKRGAQMIFLPAQFNMKTGPAHWEMSLRMRAVDNEVFFAGASAARHEGFSYECWGHSMVVDPFGPILAAADEKEQILYAEIDLSRTEVVRAQLPTFNCLREDIYAVAK